jgi:Leucine-rich repeat (LRR) protein
LTKFDISKCILRAEGGKALAAGLKGNRVITELNISNNDLGRNSGHITDTSGIIAIANAIPDMGAMTSLDVSDNNLGALVLPEGWECDKSASSWNPSKWIYKHADGREQKGDPGRPDGIIALANAIPDMRAISSVHLLENNISVEQAQNLASILKEHPTLNSLCGNSGVETELDMSGKGIGPADAVMLSVEIVGNGALTKFDISKCQLMAAGGKALAVGLKGNQVITDLNISDNHLGRNSKYSADTSGIIAIVNAIPDMGALTKLDISNNSIGGIQEGHLQHICVAGGIELAK